MSECQDTPNGDHHSNVDFFEPYASFSRTLRTWLVAYGIGAPVLFASQDAFVCILAKPIQGVIIIGLFLLGTMVQIIATFLYKYSMGYIYFGELKKEFMETRRYKISNWLSEAMWLEISFDIITIVSFVSATVYVLIVYVTREN